MPFPFSRIGRTIRADLGRENMRKHNFIARILVLSLLVSLLCVHAAAAGTSVRIDAPETLPAVGETFTVTVDISGNPGLCAAQYTLTFDGTVVECVSASVGDVLRGTLSATNPSASDGARVAAASVDPATGDGSIGVFTFRVLRAGSTSFALKDGVFSDANGADIATNVPGVSSGTAQPSQPSLGGTTGAPGSGTAGENTSGGTTFTDVPASHWAYASIERAAQLGYVTGVGGGRFEPSRQLTRAEFVTMLYRLAGKPAVSAPASFSDVGTTAWYYDAVCWAAENGYVNGTGAGTFSPDGKITRQEVVTILFRYGGAQTGAEVLLYSVYDGQYTDSGAIAPWARSAMYWAVYNGVITGTSAAAVSPTATATRAEVAAIFVRYAK